MKLNRNFVTSNVFAVFKTLIIILLIVVYNKALISFYLLPIENRCSCCLFINQLVRIYCTNYVKYLFHDYHENSSLGPVARRFICKPRSIGAKPGDVAALGISACGIADFPKYSRPARTFSLELLFSRCIHTLYYGFFFFKRHSFFLSLFLSSARSVNTRVKTVNCPSAIGFWPTVGDGGPWGTPTLTMGGLPRM